MLINLHTHTKYSLDCKLEVRDILKCLEKNYLGIAITDHNEIHNASPYAIACL